MRTGAVRALISGIAVSIACALAVCKADARPYDYSLGIRLGNYFAAEGKFFVSMSSAIDISAGLVNPFSPHYQFLVVSGAYKLHLTKRTAGLMPYIGAGLSAGTQFGDRSKERRRSRSFYMSADVPLGLEYKLPSSPVVFCLEWSPKVRFLTGVRFIPQSISLGFRYTFY